MAEETVNWTFYGYRTPAEGDPVQEWFNALHDDAKAEAIDVIYGYLRVTPRHLWTRPEFEAFDSEISEIRFKVGSLNQTYRIYGTFWPTTRRYSYTFLLGKDKKVKNDKLGKELARKRLKKLLNGEAAVHGFRFFE
jgi:hypothetical protein